MKQTLEVVESETALSLLLLLSVQEQLVIIFFSRTGLYDMKHCDSQAPVPDFSSDLHHWPGNYTALSLAM